MDLRSSQVPRELEVLVLIGEDKVMVGATIEVATATN
jgi:hypothetical protein